MAEAPDAFEDDGDDEPKAELKLEGWDERKSDYESHARPEPIDQRVKSLLRGSGSWRQGTQRNIGSQKDQGLLNDSFFSNVEDVLFDDDPGGYDSEESVEEVFEAIEGIYCPPLTLKEHEWYCTHVLNLHKETKSSWDELFFDLALVAAFGSLASCLTLSSEDSGGHRRLSESDVHMSFPRAVFLYCLETATVISVRRFTDGHRAQWRWNDLFGSLLLLGRAICCLGMGGARPASLGLRASRRWRLALSESPCERRGDGVPVGENYATPQPRPGVGLTPSARDAIRHRRESAPHATAATHRRCPRRRGAARRCMCLEVPRLERARERLGAVVRRRFVPKPADPLADLDDGGHQSDCQRIHITPVRGHFTSRLGSCGGRLARVRVMGHLPAVHVLWVLDASS